MRGVIIQGSSRSAGETHQLVSYLAQATGYPVVDLKTKDIGHFDYDFANQGDDFPPLVKELIANYDLWVWATPVYWYSMSSIMKAFLDRFSDLLKIDKPTGRLVRGKYMAVLTNASEDHLKAGFLMPFKESANYLGMHYVTNYHGWLEEGKLSTSVQAGLDQFATQLKNIKPQ